MSISEEDLKKIDRDRINLIPVSWQEFYFKVLQPIADFFTSNRMNPNTLTTLGFIFNVVAATFFTLGFLRLGGLFVLLGGLCDTLDGKIARETGVKTSFGAIYDSVMDRYSEIIMFFGIAVYFVREDSYWTSVAVFAALGGSIMVSYVRARAEGVGYECKVGIMQRPERISYIVIGALIGKLPIVNELFLQLVIWIIAILANYTAIQRLVYVYKVARADTDTGTTEDKKKD